MLLSFDPGSSKAGYGILSGEELVDFGAIQPFTTSKKFNDSMDEAIRHFIQTWDELLTKFPITEVVWEIVPSFGKFGGREKIVACATTLKVEAFKRELPYSSYTPVSWKSKLVGKGATKEDVRQHVIEVFPDLKHIDDLPWDVYDSIGLGLVHQRSKSA